METQTFTETESTPVSYAIKESPLAKPVDVEVDLPYFKQSDDGTPAQIGDMASNNPKFCDTRRVRIRDIRGKENEFHLETHGFQYFKHYVPENLVFEDEDIKAIYYPEMEKVIKAVTGAKSCLIYNHLVRNTPWTTAEYNANNKSPAKRPHVDVSKNWAPGVVMGAYRDNSKEILSKHWQLVNLWRPLKTVHKNPLAVADSSTVPISDQHIIAYERSLPTGQVYSVENYFTKGTNADKHQWYYLSQQKPEEVLVFKIYDSDEKAKAPGSTHTSFLDPRTEDMPTRESIELRCVLAY